MRDKLISVNALSDEMSKIDMSNERVAIAVIDLSEFVAKQPDALIMCEECKHRSHGKYDHLGALKYFCPKVEKYVTDEDYCFMAERAK